MTSCTDQPAAFGAAGRLWIAAIDRLLAVAAMTGSPILAASRCGTVEERIPAGFTAATKTDLPKLSTEADIAKIALISRPEHIDLRRVSIGIRGQRSNNRSEINIDSRELSRTGFATAGTNRLCLITVIERHTAVGAEFHSSPWVCLV